ncbi:MAG: hypothetical protein ACI88G_000808 [Woeseiaceae bacterium]|jgi:hypothetical protein
MGEPRWDAKRITELLGGLAVVISLIFVGIELRENATATKAEAAHNASMALHDWYLEVGTNAEAGSIFRRAMMDPESLDKDESFQFVFMLHAGLLAYQDIYFLADQGALEAGVFEVLAPALSLGRTNPGFIWFWQQRREYFSEGFRQYVDELEPNNPDGAIIYQ